MEYTRSMVLHRAKITAVLLLCLGNAVVWGGGALARATASGGPAADPAACVASPSGLPTPAQSWEQIVGEGESVPIAMVTDPACLDCYILDRIPQRHCVMRSPGTDCSDPRWPWNNNFEYERIMVILDCRGSGRRIRCGDWVRSGCCNNSSAEPPCWREDVVGGCTGMLPPD